MRSPAVDSTAVSGDDESSDAASAEGGFVPRPRLSRVEGPLPEAEPPPAVRLCREWKGPTVADLLRDEIVERLPGQVRSALRHIERGDFQRAHDALPGTFAPVLQGPGHRRRGRRRRLVVLLLVAAIVATAIAPWVT